MNMARKPEKIHKEIREDDPRQVKDEKKYKRMMKRK